MRLRKQLDGRVTSRTTVLTTYILLVMLYTY